MTEKSELTFQKIRERIEYDIKDEQFEYISALILWLIMIALVALACSFFIGGWGFLSLLIPVGIFCYMCVKWIRILQDIKKGRFFAKTDKLLYRKPESVFNLFTFINRMPNKRRWYKRISLTENVMSLYFENGARISHQWAFAGSNDTNDEMTYYLIYVGDRPVPLAAYNTAEYELSKREGESVPLIGNDRSI